MKNHYLKFWGTRGSCSVSGPEYSQFGGNTCCLEICYDNAHIIIDAGTGIRKLGQHLAQEGIHKIDLFLSHTHWDHVIGFPFFEPIDHPNTQITIWAPKGNGRSCKELFEELFAPEFFPMKLKNAKGTIGFKTVQANSPVQISPLTLDFHLTNHPGVTYCFKIKTPHQTIGYVTDNEVKEDRGLVQFLKGCDILVHESQYTPEEYTHKTGWGHSSLHHVVELIKQTAPKKWLVTHHDPKHTDADLKYLALLAQKMLHERNIPCPVEWIADGHVVTLK